MLQRLAENFSSQLLSLVAIPCPPCDVGIYPVEEMLVKLGKPQTVALRGFDQKPFLRLLPANFLCRFAAGHRSSIYINFARGKRLRRSRPRARLQRRASNDSIGKGLSDQ